MTHFILAIIVGVVAVIFALSNVAVVSVEFLLWDFEASLAIVVLISFLLGIMATLIMVLPSVWRKSTEVRKHKKQTQQLSKEQEQLAKEKQEKETEL